MYDVGGCVLLRVTPVDCDHARRDKQTQDYKCENLKTNKIQFVKIFSGIIEEMVFIHLKVRRYSQELSEVPHACLRNGGGGRADFSGGQFEGRPDC